MPYFSYLPLMTLKLKQEDHTCHDNHVGVSDAHVLYVVFMQETKKYRYDHHSMESDINDMKS